MLERLRVVAVMVRDLEEGRELYQRILGMEPCHTAQLPAYGLANLVLPAGNGTFIELLQPTSSESAGVRFLERQGEAPYCLIFRNQTLRPAHSTLAVPCGPDHQRNSGGRCAVGVYPPGLRQRRFAGGYRGNLPNQSLAGRGPRLANR